MEEDAFRRSLCTVVYVTCHVRGCCNLHLTSPTTLCMYYSTRQVLEAEVSISIGGLQKITTTNAAAEEEEN